MACRPSVPVLYFLNFVLFAVSVCMIAFPFAGTICPEFCNVAPRDLKSITFINVLVYFGAALLLFSLIGCCLAHTAKKRYRFFYVTTLTLLLASLGAMTVYAYDDGFVIDSIHTFDPAAPANIDKAIASLSSKGMKLFYEDFATLYEKGDCNQGEAKFDCPNCHVLSNALNTCEEDWITNPETTKYLDECTKTLDADGSTWASLDCGPECTEQFCKCTGELQDIIKKGATYAKIFVASLTGTLLILWYAACCVERTARLEEQQRRELEEQQHAMLAHQGYNPNGIALANAQSQPTYM